MSYLDNIRLVFTGKFQADVSTVNNDVRHFDNATFQPTFQKFMTGPSWNGWWNPTGSGAFRLINCRVVMVGYGDGTTATEDAAVGLRVAASENHTSGKIVDIDPQWQLASALWGLDVRLTDGKEPGFFSGHYRPHAFRDLWFGRMLNANGSPGGGDGAASATFQSVLENVAWADDLKGSRALAELKDAATDGLSIRLTTFSYIDQNPNGPDFTLGTVTGVIGPQRAGEPESFVLGRRFAPANGITSWNGCGYSVARVDSKARRLLVDLSNGLQLAFANRDPAKGPVSPIGALNDIGTLQLGILKNADVTEFTPATEDNFLPRRRDRLPGRWLAAQHQRHRGVRARRRAACPARRPSARARRGRAAECRHRRQWGKFGQIAIRETTGGLFVEAEPIVHRIDAPGKCEATIYAARYGAALANAQVAISQLGDMPNQGGGQGGGPNTPAASIPDIGVPQSAFKIPATVTTGADGTAKLPIAADDPGNPRKYIDGQLYLIDFRLPGQGNQARSGFDYIVTHVRDAYTVPDAPTWETDVAPIFTQYGNLYPIMSKQLVNLSNPHDVKRHAKILRLAFAQPMASANHMPVTRDLSQGKRDMILKFLDRLIAEGEPTLEAALKRAAPAAPYDGAGPRQTVDHPGGKTMAARAFARATGVPGLR